MGDVTRTEARSIFLMLTRSALRLARCNHVDAERSAGDWCSRCGAQRFDKTWIRATIAAVLTTLDRQGLIPVPPDFDPND